MKKKLEDYRKGIFGALLDEHDKAFEELLDLVTPLPEHEFRKTIDSGTEDPNCKSISTICTHVIGAIYGYIALMRKTKDLGDKEGYPLSSDDIKPFPIPDILHGAYTQVIEYMIDTLNHYKEFEEEPWTVFVTSKSGNKYDFELLLEHSVVHILRHRRQIEKFILMLN